MCTPLHLDPPQYSFQTASQSVQPFLHSLQQRVPILCNGPPLKIAHTHRNLDSHLIHGSIGPPPKWHLNQFSLFCRAHNHDRQTDHANPFVTIGRIYICSTAMQPKKENKQGNQNYLGAHCSYTQICYTNTVRKNLSKIASVTTSELFLVILN